MFLVRGKLDKGIRVTLGALTVIDVHGKIIQKHIRIYNVTCITPAISGASPCKTSSIREVFSPLFTSALLLLEEAGVFVPSRSE